VSIKAMNWAWSISLAPTPKIVLLALCDIADDSGFCYPSIHTLATKCTLDERTVQRVIRKLTDEHFLAVEERFRRDGARTSNGYRISLAPTPAICHPLPIADATGRLAAVTGGPRQRCHRGGDTAAGVTTTEPSIDPSTTTEPPGVVGQEATEEEVNTQSRRLWFPDNTSQEQRAAMKRQCASLTEAGAQAVLDELAGRMRCSKVRDPVRYCARLVELSRRGEFRLELGLEIARNREAMHRRTTRSVVPLIESGGEATSFSELPEPIRSALERARARASRGRET
jgi:hypothetical protein